MKKKMNRVMNSLRSRWSQPAPSRSMGSGCCVDGCDRSPALVVAAVRGRDLSMCLEHAQGWVESDTCRDINRNNQPRNMARLQRWATPRPSGRALPPPVAAALR